MRKELLKELIQCNSDLFNIVKQLKKFSWDISIPLITLTRQNIVRILTLFLTGELTESQVEEWGNAIECREDIAYESGHETLIKDTIHFLANPLLTVSLNVTNAQAWMKKLEK